MEILTQKQQKIFNFIERRLAANSPPSQKEVASHFGMAQNAAYQLINYLKKKGYLGDSGVHRGLRLSEQYLAFKQETKGLPIVGRVAAGEPVLAQQNITGYMDIGNVMMKQSENAFLLKVAGDSMIDEGIMDGDYVVIKPQTIVENGQIGVALIEDEATVKRIFIKADEVVLKPANAKYKPRSFKRGGKAVRIIGKVIGCFRVI